MTHSSISFGEVAIDDQRSSTQARRGVGGSDRTASVDMPVTIGQSRARTLAEIMLAEMWMARESMETALPPSLLAVEAGDVLHIGDQRGLWRVASISDGQARTAQLSRFDPRIYSPARFPSRPKYPIGSDATGSAQASPVIFFMDLPLLLDNHNPDAGYLAEYMKPIGAGIAAYRSPSTSNYSLDLVLPLAAITGLTLAPFNAGVLNRWDNANVLDVEIKSHELSVSDDLSVLAGANAIAIKQPSGEWEIIQFVDVETIGTKRYRLTRLLRGQKGSEHAMAEPLAAGARVEDLPYGEFIQRYDRPTTLFYLDPPYWGNENDYGKGLFNREDFAELSGVLSNLSGRFIMSLNDRPEVRETFKSFHIEAVKTTYSIGAKCAKRVGEVLISN